MVMLRMPGASYRKNVVGCTPDKDNIWAIFTASPTCGGELCRVTRVNIVTNVARGCILWPCVEVKDSRGVNVGETGSLFETYWKLRMESAHRKMEAALELIEHKPSRGALAEDLVRELIESFLPKRWTTGTGFVVDEDKRPTLQLDVLLFDQNEYAPFYRDEHMVVLPKGSGPLAVEVKSVLNKEDLSDALGNVASLKGMDPTAKANVFAFRGMTSDTLRGHLMAHVEETKTNGTFNPNALPDMICLLQRRVVVRLQPSGGHHLVAYEAIDPVVQFLLGQVLNDLKVASLYPLLPKPRAKPDPLFMV